MNIQQVIHIHINDNASSIVPTMRKGNIKTSYAFIQNILPKNNNIGIVDNAPTTLFARDSFIYHTLWNTPLKKPAIQLPIVAKSGIVIPNNARITPTNR